MRCFMQIDNKRKSKMKLFNKNNKNKKMFKMVLNFYSKSCIIIKCFNATNDRWRN